MFGTEDGLVAAVIHAIQGFLDPAARVIEEAALSKLLAGSVPLTVVLDGLDEAHNPEAVRRAITYWLRSKLCPVGILIVTSRREFWRTCVESSWVRWMPSPNSDDRSPVKVADRSQVEKSDPAAGLRLPDRFSEGELEAAWLRAGRPRSELAILPDDARGELRHPFTLRVFLDLQMREGHPPPTVTRAALLERWLNHRLDAEALPRERITRSHFQQALRVVASRIAETNAGSVTVDELAGVPRFDPSHPPGPVLQRLIEAGILESLPSQPDQIRFTVEAVQDFYRTKEHAKAVTVLAYLGDGRLVDHLAARLAENGRLDYYENHALIALGSDAAGMLFARSVMAVGERLAPLPNDHANQVIGQARSRQDGPKWLRERLHHLSRARGWRRGEYYTHIHTPDLVGYLESHCEPGSPEQNWSIGGAFRQIDSPEVRGLLRKWGDRRGSPEDPLVRESDQRRISDMCYWELRNRGDVSAIGYTLDERADERDDIYVALAADHLRTFPTAAVAEQLRLRLNRRTTPSETLRMLALLGRFGEQADAELASRFVDHPDDLVANVACEAMLRLSDPLLFPDRWREI